jgi:hypothetical protein
VGKTKELLLYKFCLILVGTSTLTVGMNLYNVRQQWKERKSLNKVLGKENGMKHKKETQMERVKKQSVVDVAFLNNKAYWVQNNVLYHADVLPSGEILTEEAEPVDVINMPKGQLQKIIKIVDSFNK